MKKNKYKSIKINKSPKIKIQEENILYTAEDIVRKTKSFNKFIDLAKKEFMDIDEIKSCVCVFLDSNNDIRYITHYNQGVLCSEVMGSIDFVKHCIFSEWEE